MARFETSLVIPRPLAATFAFVTDFRNAPRWDPRTYEAQQTTPGPIGLGTKFLLLGGLVSKPTLDRLHVPDWLRHASKLDYEVVSFVPRSELVVRGETSTLRYEDHLVFEAAGDATRLRYVATMELKGVLEIGEPILQPIFDTIGADATQGIPAAVEAAVPAPVTAPVAEALLPPLPGNPIVGPDDVRRVVALDQHVLRNLFVTQGYHDLSKQIAARTGGGDMNWCTLGSWASGTAGTFIRDDEVPTVFRKLLDAPGALGSRFDEVQRKLHTGPEAPGPRLLEIARAILHDCSTYIMVGNTVVYAELAQCCADFMQALGGDTAPDPARLAAFQARYTEGDPLPDQVEWDASHTQLSSRACGGQAMLRGMVGHLYQAMFEPDPKRRAEHILFANAQGGLHEQTRLQTYIVGGLDAPLTDTLVAWAHKHVDRDAPRIGRGLLHELVDAEIPRVGHLIEDAWEDFSTDVLMTLTLPDGVLHLGHPISQDPGVPLVPPALETIADPALASLLDKYGALNVRVDRSVYDALKDRVRALFHDQPDGDAADVGALDWTSFEQRMRYILTLFRLRQQDPHLFQQPFTDPQRAAIFARTIPQGLT